MNWRTGLYGACAGAVVVGMFTLSFFENVAMGILLIGMLIVADRQNKL